MARNKRYNENYNKTELSQVNIHSSSDKFIHLIEFMFMPGTNPLSSKDIKNLATTTPL